MSRSALVAFSVLAAALAACSNRDGPFGYGYAVNARPSLSQLSSAPGDPDNPYRAATRAEPAADEK